jgi:hypothetical protein
MKSKEVKLKKKTHKGDILYFSFCKVALHYSFYNKKINKLHKSAVVKRIIFWGCSKTSD